MSAGLLILLMSVTGVLLMYERQLIAWSDRAYRSTPSAAAARLPPGTLLLKVHEAHPDLTPTADDGRGPRGAGDADHRAAISLDREPAMP